MSETSKKRLFVIDTDAGVDDAQAIFMALAQPEVKVIAITTCHGNTSAKQVTKNVLRLLKVVNRLDIPVYEGSEQTLLGGTSDYTGYHGEDGLGDVPDDNPPNPNLVQPQHAVNTLIQLANQHEGELTLVALGPLTNIALAIRLDPTFGSKLKECYIMGGNYEGQGNVSPSGEFNFYTDPEAAHIVLNELACPITLACWELCLKHSLPWSWYEQFVGQGTDKANFIKSIEKQILDKYYKDGAEYQTADQTIMAATLNKKVQKNVVKAAVSVEIHGSVTRGQCVVDWTGSYFKDKPKINIIKELDEDLYKSMLMESLGNHTGF